MSVKTERRVNTNAMRAASVKVDSLGERFSEQIAIMNNTGHELCASWKGELSDQFRDTLAKDLESYRQIIDCILQFAKEIREAARKYDAMTSELLRNMKNK